MTSKETQKNPKHEDSVGKTLDKYLILHNDDYHSFDYVIEALMEVCDHEFDQAAQCTLITHHKGSCDIKKGKLQELQPLKEALIKKELTASID